MFWTKQVEQRLGGENDPCLRLCISVTIFAILSPIVYLFRNNWTISEYEYRALSWFWTHNWVIISLP